MKTRFCVVLVLFGVLCAPHGRAEEQMQLSLRQQLLRCTARIETAQHDGSRHMGTGFFYDFSVDSNTVPTVVTCRHVIKDAVQGIVYFQLRGSDVRERSGHLFPLKLSDFESKWIVHPDPEIDLAVLPVGPLHRRLHKEGKRIDYRSLNKDLFPSEKELEDIGALQPIAFVGYPIGLWDSVNNLPIARQGITATDPSINHNGKTVFMIDAACFPGSSGSPIFLFNEGGYTRPGGMVMGSRIKFLGILYAIPQHSVRGTFEVQTIPTAMSARPVTNIPTDLGYVIKASRLLQFQPVFGDMLKDAKSSKK